MSGFYEELCNLLIRPARQTYTDYDLGIQIATQVRQPSAASPSAKTSPSRPPKTSK